MTDNQERWYRQTLSNNMNRAGKKLGYMLTKAYCVAWEEDILQFATLLCNKSNEQYNPIGNRMDYIENISEKTADKVAQFCKSKHADNRFSSGYELLEFVKKKDQQAKAYFNRFYNDEFAECLKICFDNEDSSYWEQCIEAMDLAACCKILSVGDNENATENETKLLDETYRRVCKKFPAIERIGKSDLIIKMRIGSKFRNKEAHNKVLGEKTQLLQVAQLFRSEETESAYQSFIREVESGERRLEYRYVTFQEISAATGETVEKCRNVLEELCRDDADALDADGIYCASSEWAIERVLNDAERRRLKEVNEKQKKQIEQLMTEHPEMSREEAVRTFKETVVDEKLKKLPALRTLRNYQYGDILEGEQVRELMSTHLILLDASVLMDAGCRKFITNVLVPYAQQIVAGGGLPPFIVEARTRYEIFQEHQKGDKTAYYFMEDILRKNYKVLRYQGLHNLARSLDESMTDFVKANALERICILVRGASKLPGMIAEEQYPLCVVARIQKIPRDGVVLLKRNQPLAEGTSQEHMHDRLLWSYRLEESAEDQKLEEKVFRQMQKAPEKRTIPKSKKGTASSLYTSDGTPVNLTKVLTEDGQKAEGGEGRLYETDYNNLVAKIYHEGKRTSEREKKILYMIEHPLTGNKRSTDNICWPEEILYDSDHVFQGFLMKRVPQGYLQLGRSVLMISRPEVQKSILPEWNREDLVKVATGFAYLLETLHANKVLMGDVNAGNIMVDPKNAWNVYLVDCDSYQIADFPCPVGKEEYTHPHMAARLGMAGKLSFEKCIRTLDEEQYSAAILIFQILMVGGFPFASTSGKTLVQAMRDRDFPYLVSAQQASEEDRRIKAPDGYYWMLWKNTPRQIQQVFWDTFKNWKTCSSHEWITKLNHYRWQMNNQGFTRELAPKKYHEYHPEDPDFVDVTCQICHEEFNVYKTVTNVRYCKNCNQFMKSLDNKYGIVWYTCDRCGKEVDRMARFGYMKERIEGFEILCPDCYKKKKELG